MTLKEGGGMGGLGGGLGMPAGILSLWVQGRIKLEMKAKRDIQHYCN